MPIGGISVIVLTRIGHLGLMIKHYKVIKHFVACQKKLENLRGNLIKQNNSGTSIVKVPLLL